MSLQQREMVRQILRDAPFDLGGEAHTQRPLLEQMLTARPMPEDVRTTPGELGLVPAVFIDLDQPPSRGVILHMHGGGFAVGSAAGSVGLASALARKAGMSVVSVDYRLAPENPYPGALDDVTAAYRALLAREGGAGRIVVSGESAGGNLAVELLIAAKQADLSMPAAVVVFSPMTDLTITGDSYRSKAEFDPTITADAIRTRANDYLAGTGTDPADPVVSPIFADLTGLPPLLIQVGSRRSAPRRRHPTRRPGPRPTTSPSPWTSHQACLTCSRPSPLSSRKVMPPSTAPALSSTNHLPQQADAR